jgi:hypothetical protein
MLNGLHYRCVVLAMALLWPSVEAGADTIRKACQTSDRGFSQPRLCRCIQGAADRTLSSRDQRRAARFFRDREEAERARRSDSRRDEAFWDRYEQFGEIARKSCG